MKRRQAIAAIAAIGTITTPPWASAQPPKPVRVALVFGPPEAAVKAWENAFLEELRVRGYVKGGNLVFDVRYASGDAARVPVLVDEALAQRPDVLVGFESVARVMRSKTASIPIVLTHSSDPVGLGLAASLANPGGNVTGISMVHEQAISKVIEIYKEVLPRLARLGVILDATAPGSKLAEAHARKTATALGITIVPFRASSHKELESALGVLGQSRLDGLTIGGPLPALLGHASQIVDAAAQLKLPFAFPGSAASEERAIFWFGANLPQAYRDAARYVDRILKGAKPGSLPIEQPTRFELVVNQKHAKSLGLTVPQSVLLRADRVIE